MHWAGAAPSADIIPFEHCTFTSALKFGASSAVLPDQALVHPLVQDMLLVLPAPRIIDIIL